MRTSTPRRFGAWWRWVPLFLTALALVTAGVWDHSLKESPFDGFCPEDARYIAAAENFGMFWAGMERSDAWESLSHEMGYPIGPAVLALRQTTGIRPTPLQWSAWMGGRFLASEGPTGVGICVHPGMLIRIASRLRSAAGLSYGKDGMAQYGPYWCAWRDGFLIVSTSKDYVRAALTAPPPRLPKSNGRDEMRIAIPAAHEAVFRLRGKNGWPVEGQIRFAIGSRKAPLSLVNAWPGVPLLAVTAPRWQDISAAAGLVNELIGSGPWRTRLSATAGMISQRWAFDALPADWDSQVEECGLALTSVDTAETLPVPSLAMLLKSASPQIKTHPLAPLLSGMSTIPYEWESQRGVAAPVLGEKVTLCLCRSGKVWIATSNEPLMASLAGKTRDGDAVDSDLAVRMDWKQVGATLERLLTIGGELELFPEHNKSDLEGDALPMLKALGRLGSLRLDGQDEGQMLKFNGFLAYAPTRREAPGK